MMRFVAALFYLLVVTGTVYAQGVTLEQMVSLKSVDKVRMSPNEKLIAFTQNVPRDLNSEEPGPDWQELYIVNSKGLIRPLIIGSNQIERLQWDQESSQIWLLMRRGDEPWFSVYMIRPDGGEAVRVIGKKSHIHGFNLHPDGEQILYWYPDQHIVQDTDEKQVEVIDFEYELQRNHHLHEVTLNDNGSTDKKLPEFGHILSAQYSPDGDKLLIKAAPSYLTDDIVMQPFFLVTDSTGKEIFQVANRGKLAKALFSPDGESIAFIGAETPSSPDHGGLYVSEIASGKTQQLITNFEGMVTDISWPEDRSILFLADIGVGSILALKSIQNPSDSYRTLLKSELIFRKIHSPDDNDVIALVANNQNHPNELFWYKKRILSRITDSNPGLQKQALGRQSVHRYKGLDGLELQGVMVSPSGASDKALPTIIFAHGGPEAHVSDGWNSHHLRPVHVLAGKGFRSFLPNYRGSTARGDTFLKAGQGDYAGAEFDDLLAAKQWLIKKGYAKQGQIGIAGGSYGGYAAAWAATKFSEHFQAAVSFAGIGNKVSKFGTTDIPTEMLQTHALSQPWDSWEKWLKASPIYYSDKHQTPLLLIHGTRDKRVNYSQSMELYRHLKHRNQAPVQLLLYPDRGHYILDSHTQYHQAQRMVGWFEEYLTEKD